MIFILPIADTVSHVILFPERTPPPDKTSKQLQPLISLDTDMSRGIFFLIKKKSIGQCGVQKGGLLPESNTMPYKSNLHIYTHFTMLSLYCGWYLCIEMKYTTNYQG